MKILVAKTAGFCMGVRRAVDLAVDTSAQNKGPILTLGPLIHNNQTLEMLRERGVTPLGSTSPEQANQTIIVRAHGVPPGTMESLTRQGHTIVDGTCPKVRTVHKVITKYRNEGYTIAIAGDEGHAEVIGLLGYAGDSGFLIQSVNEVDALPQTEKICLVSQTTFDKNTFDAMAARLRERYEKSKVVVKRTICSATDRRQDETRGLAAKVDTMIVVGGKNSANTLRLAKISDEVGTRTIHVETEKEITLKELGSAGTVGITAGASTPNWMIKRVIDHLQYLDQTRRHTVGTLFWRVLDLLANLNVFAALGGAAMYYASCYLQGYEFIWSGAIVTFLYLFSMYLWNGIASVETTRHLGLSRSLFYNAHRRLLLGVTFAGIAAFLIVSSLVSPALLQLMLLATAAGTAYHFSIVPSGLRGLIRYGTIRDIPTSKDLFVGLAWGVVVTFAPQAAQPDFALEPSAILFFLWMFFLAYVRSVIFDLRDIEGDRIMGRETLVTILGERRTRRGITLALIFSFAAILVAGFLVFFPLNIVRDAHVIRFLFQTPTLLYTWLFMKFSRHFTSRHPALFSLVADGQFLVAAVGAWVASMLV